MRLDKYLKVSRIIKRRGVAKEACEGGMVLLNDKPAKPGATIKVGDILEVKRGSGSRRYEILALREHAPADEAKEMYEEL